MIDVHGVGYLVSVTPAHALALAPGEQATVLTVHIVREDSVSLFGFATEEEREAFELLIGVTGVGPKSALGVLSALSPNEIARAVETEDDRAFRAVSGIGPKTAKLITVSLSGKLVATLEPGGSAVASAVPDAVVAALTGLGWPEKTAKSALDRVLETADEATRASVPALLRSTLTDLGGSR